MVFKDMHCSTEQEVTDWVIREALGNLTGPLVGLVIGGYFLVFEPGEWKFRKEKKS